MADKPYVIQLQMTGIVQLLVSADSEEDAERKIEDGTWDDEMVLEWDAGDILSIERAPDAPARRGQDMTTDAGLFAKARKDENVRYFKRLLRNPKLGKRKRREIELILEECLMVAYYRACIGEYARESLRSFKPYMGRPNSELRNLKFEIKEEDGGKTINIPLVTRIKKGERPNASEPGDYNCELHVDWTR